MMKTLMKFPTLGQSMYWTALFYVIFGWMLSILGWLINNASANILLRMLGLNIPSWVTGWFFLLVSVPVFAAAGAISGLLIYWPVKMLVNFISLNGRQSLEN